MSDMQARLECLNIAQFLSSETEGLLAAAKHLYGFVAGEGVKSESTPHCHSNRFLMERVAPLYLHP